MAKKGTKAPGVGGRPLFKRRDEALIVAKLEEVWGLGGSDAEAAFFADILPCTLSRYLDKHPFVKQRKEALLKRPLLLARRAVIEAFDGHVTKVPVAGGKPGETRDMAAPKDSDAAIKYLERKHKAEFATRQEITGADGGPLSAEVLGRKVAMSEEASALAAKMVEALGGPKDVKSK